MLQLIFLLIYLSYNDGNEDGKNTKTSYKRQERTKKSHETYMKRLNEDIVRHNQLSSSCFTDNSTPLLLLLQIIFLPLLLLALVTLYVWRWCSCYASHITRNLLRT